MVISPLHGQTLSTTYMQGKGTGFVGFNKEQATARQFYVGSNLIDGLIVFDKTEHIAINLYGTYGISERIDVSAKMTKASTRGMGNLGFENELGIDLQQSGIQDLRITGNFLISETSYDKGSLRVNGLAEWILPIGNYSIGDGFQSLLAIGNSMYGIGTGVATLYQFSSGFYFSMENRFQINSGAMPHAVQNHMFAGYMNKDIIIEVYGRNYFALSGPEIFGIGFEGLFPYSNIRRHSLGLYVCKPIGSGIVMTSSVETMLGGMNTAKDTWTSLGLGYVFGQNKMRLNHY